MHARYIYSANRSAHHQFKSSFCPLTVIPIIERYHIIVQPSQKPMPVNGMVDHYAPELTDIAC